MPRKQKPERPSELLARRTLETLLDVQLVRVEEGDTPTRDYEMVTDDGLWAIEVKEIVSSDYLKVQAVLERQSFWPSTLLTRHWDVAIDTPTNVDQFEPARIRGLAEAIEGDLAILEAAEITCTRGADDQATGEAFAALWRIKFRTNDSICMSSTFLDDRGPGIELEQGHGYVRTARADVFAERVQAWLDSSASTNLRGRHRLARAFDNDHLSTAPDVVLRDVIEVWIEHGVEAVAPSFP